MGKIVKCVSSDWIINWYIWLITWTKFAALICFHDLCFWRAWKLRASDLFTRWYSVKTRTINTTNYSRFAMFENTMGRTETRLCWNERRNMWETGIEKKRKTKMNYNYTFSRISCTTIHHNKQIKIKDRKCRYHFFSHLNWIDWASKLKSTYLKNEITTHLNILGNIYLHRDILDFYILLLCKFSCCILFHPFYIYMYYTHHPLSTYHHPL